MIFIPSVSAFHCNNGAIQINAYMVKKNKKKQQAGNKFIVKNVNLSQWVYSIIFTEDDDICLEITPILCRYFTAKRAVKRVNIINLAELVK